MSALHISQCGTVCELHWFDTAPEHIHQPPRSLVDDEMHMRRLIDWTRAGAPGASTPLEVMGPNNPRSTLYMFMQRLSRTEVRQIADTVASDGDADALEYPLGHLVKVIRKMDAKTAAEAWELYGQGVRP